MSKRLREENDETPRKHDVNSAKCKNVLGLGLGLSRGCGVRLALQALHDLLECGSLFRVLRNTPSHQGRQERRRFIERWVFRKQFLRAYMVDNLRDLVAFPRQAARKQFVEKDAICVDIVFEVIFTLAVKALRAHPRSGSGRSARLRSSGGGHNAVLVAYYLATIVRVKDDMHGLEVPMRGPLAVEMSHDLCDVHLVVWRELVLEAFEERSPSHKSMMM